MSVDSDIVARHLEDEGADDDRYEYCSCLLVCEVIPDEVNYEDFGEIVICNNDTCKNYRKVLNRG